MKVRLTCQSGLLDFLVLDEISNGRIGVRFHPKFLYGNVLRVPLRAELHFGEDESVMVPMQRRDREKRTNVRVKSHSFDRPIMGTADSIMVSLDGTLELLRPGDRVIDLKILTRNYVDLLVSGKSKGLLSAPPSIEWYLPDLDRYILINNKKLTEYCEADKETKLTLPESVSLYRIVIPDKLINE